MSGRGLLRFEFAPRRKQYEWPDDITYTFRIPQMNADNPYGPFDAAGGETIKCPYCGEPDFDAIGLKSHLLSDCEEFAATPKLNRIFPTEGES